MKRALILIGSVLLFSACAQSIPQEQSEEDSDSPLPPVLVPSPGQVMELKSSVFENGGEIPSKYTCDGDNVNPPLQISGVPKGTVSLVLLMEDPDVPKNIRPDGMWDHWVVFNMPSDTAEIPENTQPPGVIGANSGGKNAYGGPCPPDREHRYFFKLIALNATLDLPEGSSKSDVEARLNQGNILALTQLMGRYGRH